MVSGSLECAEGSEFEFASCFEFGRILLVCILCLSVFVSLLELLLMLAIPVFFCILANGTIWSPSASLWFLVLLHWGLADLVPGVQSLQAV